jgi:hypothetical protein
MSKAVIGHILSDKVNYNRDAIHVPIMPVFALENLNPGDKIRLVKQVDGEAFGATKAKKNPMAVVDPFLTDPVIVGEKFYAWVRPSTVHKLWHEWTHPLFDKE